MVVGRMKNCKTCGYCEGEAIQLEENAEEVTQYFCHCDPPQVFFSEEGIHCWFPVVTETMWCGKWIHKDE